MSKHQDNDTPSYYVNNNDDLYTLLIDQYGLDAWQQHAEMEAIQYLWRCRKKGDYITDIKKALVILQRIIEESSGDSV